MTIAVDFDGTIVEHRYPAIGKEKPFAIETLKAITGKGHHLILWTVRTGERLEEALAFCQERGLQFYAVNSNYPPGYMFAGSAAESRKIKADIYIDDHNLGGLPDWGSIYETICGAQEHSRHQVSGWRRLFRGKKQGR